MPQDELATLLPSSSHRELAATNPGLRFIILLGLLDAFGPLGIDMYLPAFPHIEQDLQARGGAMQLTLSLFLAGLADRSAHLRTDIRPRRTAATAPLRFGRLCSRLPGMRFRPLNRGPDRCSVRHGAGGLDGDGHRQGSRARHLRGSRLVAHLFDAHARDRHRTHHFPFRRRLAPAIRRLGIDFLGPRRIWLHVRLCRRDRSSRDAPNGTS